jgi:hypothetical protein
MLNDTCAAACLQTVLLEMSRSSASGARDNRVTAGYDWASGEMLFCSIAIEVCPFQTPR